MGLKTPWDPNCRGCGWEYNECQCLTLYEWLHTVTPWHAGFRLWATQQWRKFNA